ncbi:MAG: protein kinase [Bdellovibrionaceae bacterium]|nr:protein kinase [Pseudobdellovibrionaceae bacterium]
MTFKKLGKYTLLEQMAVGGMAEIHLSISAGAEGIHKFFAIKKILTAFSESDAFVTMFKEEARIASQLNHSNIVNIFDFDIDQTNQFYIVMEFVHGKNLKQILQALGSENRKLPIEFIVFIIQEVASGLDYAHKACDIYLGKPLNIIHRDVSPQNIMVSYNAEIKLIDFGIAKSSVKSEFTNSGTLKGKFGYMSPEQVRGDELDHRTDLFSLGVITWELLANHRLFASATEVETFEKISKGAIPDLSQYVDAKYIELVNIVNRCLHSDRQQRFQSGQELSSTLNTFLNVHFPEFNKHIFSDYMKNTFHYSYENSQEKLAKYSQINPNMEDSPEPASTLKVYPPGTAPSNATTPEEKATLKIQELNELKDLQRKKDLKWIYASFGFIFAFLIYFIAFEGPLKKTKSQSTIVTISEINRSKINIFKSFEMNFEPIISQMTGIGNQACIQTIDQKTYCWGDNRFHQLGVNTNKDYVQLLEITTFPKWEELQIGLFHSCGITKTQKDDAEQRTLKCWGDNSYGQIGDPTQQNAATPTTVDPNTQYQKISVGLYHTCGLTIEGTAKCWGRGDFSQLGLPHIKSSKVPLIVDAKLKFKAIASGAYHTCGLLENDTLRCWGRSDFGQVGSGQISFQGIIQNIDIQTRYKQIALGEFHSCGITIDDKLKCWGKNDFGQLGVGHQESLVSPTLISDTIKFSKVKLGKFHTCGRTLTNDLLCWGRNNYFQLSQNPISHFLKPTLTTRLKDKSDFLLGEFSTCFSLPRKLSCRGYHWAQDTRSPAQAN